MKQLLSLLFIITTISCSIVKRPKFEYHFGTKENVWINNFKTEFFFSCIRQGYKNDTIFKLISKKDLLYRYEPFAYQHNEIDIIANKIIQNIPRPIYAPCDDCTDKEKDEEYKKNYICATCLNYYASRELDSIAKKTYNKYEKKSN